MMDELMVAAAVARARSAVLARQLEDGRWVGFNDGGPALLAVWLVLMRHLGALTAREAELGERTLRRAQHADGGMPAYRFAERGDISAAVCALAAFHALGLADSDAAVRGARAWVEAHGGERSAHSVARVVLALSGVTPASPLPAPPLVWRLVPGAERFVALGFRVLVPLVYAVLATHAVTAILDGLRRGPPRRGLRARSARDLIDYFSARQAPSGGWAGVPIVTLLVACALVAQGVAAEDGRVSRAVAYARDACDGSGEELRVRVFLSDHWDTAQFLHMLLEAGLPAEDARLERATAVLLHGQNNRPAPRDWQTVPAGQSRTGGWSYESDNELLPDADTTSEVLGALSLRARRLPRRSPELSVALAHGARWIRAMQNPDGGWAAFTHGEPRPPPGPLYLPSSSLPAPWRPSNPLSHAVHRARRFVAESGDPSTADITGRVLWGLGQLERTPSDSSVRRALTFLQRHQVPGQGGWWGRWACNYLAGTAYVLAGLGAVGVPASTPWVADAVRFVLSRQNPDGGWGESLDSYTDLAAAGRGPSTATLTGVVLWALRGLDLPRTTPALDRAAGFLVARQSDDGAWHDTQCYAVMIPSRTYYFNETHALCLATNGLTAWLGTRAESVSGDGAT